MDNFSGHLPEGVYGEILDYIPSATIGGTSTPRRAERERVAKVRSSNQHWIVKIANKLNIDPSSVVLPPQLNAEDVYQDIRRLKKIINNESLQLIVKWLTGAEGLDIDTLKLWVTKQRVGAIGKFLLLPDALANYNGQLPDLVDLPNPTLTKMRLRGVNVDLDRAIPKPGLKVLHVRYSDMMTHQ